MQKIYVSLDGGVTYQEAKEGVRVMYKDVMVPGEELPGDLHLNATHEGIISDIWVTRDNEDHNIGTRSETIDDLLSQLVEDNN